MNRASKWVASCVVGVALVGMSLVAASPAMASPEIDWIMKSTKSGCIAAVEGKVRAASYSGYTNIKASSCTQYSNTWQAFVSYNT
jgi:Holliday junction resolvase-like predicted endonuclease